MHETQEIVNEQTEHVRHQKQKHVKPTQPTQSMQSVEEMAEEVKRMRKDRLKRTRQLRGYVMMNQESVQESVLIEVKKDRNKETVLLTKGDFQLKD